MDAIFLFSFVNFPTAHGPTAVPPSSAMAPREMLCKQRQMVFGSLVLVSVCSADLYFGRIGLACRLQILMAMTP